MISPYTFIVGSMFWIIGLMFYSRWAAGQLAIRFDLLQDTVIPTLNKYNQVICNNVTQIVAPYCLHNLKEFWGFKHGLVWSNVILGLIAGVITIWPGSFPAVILTYFAMILVSGTVVSFFDMRRTLKRARYGTDLINTVARSYALQDLPDTVVPELPELTSVVAYCEKTEIWEQIFHIEKEKDNER